VYALWPLLVAHLRGLVELFTMHWAQLGWARSAPSDITSDDLDEDEPEEEPRLDTTAKGGAPSYPASRLPLTPAQAHYIRVCTMQEATRAFSTRPSRSATIWPV
jgi:hypothetical protein